MCEKQLISPTKICQEDSSVDIGDDRCIGITTKGHRCKLKISKKDLEIFWAMNASLPKLIHLRYCKRQHRQLVNQDARQTDAWNIVITYLQQHSILKSETLCT